MPLFTTTHYDFMTLSKFYPHFGFCLLALALLFLMGFLPPIACRLRFFSV